MLTIKENRLAVFILFLIANGLFVVNANAVDNEMGGIVVGRYVPQRSAIRPSAVPGHAVFVDTSPDDQVINALDAKNNMASLHELNENEVAAIATNSPLQHISSDTNISGVDNNFSVSPSGAGIGSSVTQATAGISATLTGSSGAITGSVNRATSSIGQAISGATGILR